MAAINRVINLDFKSWSINESNTSKATATAAINADTYNSDYLKPRYPYVNPKPFQSKTQKMRVVTNENGELTSQASMNRITQAEAAIFNESYLKPAPGGYYKDAVIRPWSKAWAKEQLNSSAGEIGSIVEPNIINDPSILNKLKYLIINDTANTDEYKRYVAEVQTIERYVANYPIKTAMASRLTAINQLVTTRLRPNYIPDAAAGIQSSTPRDDIEDILNTPSAVDLEFNDKKKDDDVDDFDDFEETLNTPSAVSILDTEEQGELGEEEVNTDTEEKVEQEGKVSRVSSIDTDTDELTEAELDRRFKILGERIRSFTPPVIPVVKFDTKSKRELNKLNDEFENIDEKYNETIELALSEASVKFKDVLESINNYNKFENIDEKYNETVDPVAVQRITELE